MWILGAVAGASAGASLLLLTHVAPWFALQRVVRDIDEPRVFGKRVTRREAHLIGATVHIVISTLFGALYGHFVDQSIAPGFDVLPLLGWGGVMALVFGGIVMPLEGHGIFGVREDAWFPVDLSLTCMFWAVLYWVFTNVWVGLG